MVLPITEPASKCSVPPAPEVPLPTDTLTSPPRPPVAAPDPTRTAPLLPESALPELKSSRPLLPELPPFALKIIILPLLVAVPSPPWYQIAPPEDGVLRAASSARLPPLPEVPLPTEITTWPACPAVAEPDPKQRAPVFPAELPLLKTRCPLAPDLPAFELKITIAPLLEAVPSPDTRLNWPPVRAVLRPEVQNTLPPIPLVPEPTASRVAPPEPAVPAPLPKEIWPLLPNLDTPELKVRRPLEPAVPAFMLVSAIEPLLVEAPSPPFRWIKPPVAACPQPATSWKTPPAPLVPLPTDIRIAPDVPPVADPVPIAHVPLLPDCDVPETNERQPLPPVTPELAVVITIFPLLVAVPSAP